MSEIFTELPLELDGRVIRTITVPFSEAEVETLRAIFEIREGWRSEVSNGSGWHRNLYTDLRIPWGTILLNRDTASERARGAVNQIEALLSREEKSRDLLSLEGDLRAIADGLLRVFPQAAGPSPSPET